MPQRDRKILLFLPHAGRPCSMDLLLTYFPFLWFSSFFPGKSRQSLFQKQFAEHCSQVLIIVQRQRSCRPFLLLYRKEALPLSFHRISPYIDEILPFPGNGSPLTDFLQMFVQCSSPLRSLSSACLTFDWHLQTYQTENEAFSLLHNLRQAQRKQGCLQGGSRPESYLRWFLQTLWQWDIRLLLTPVQKNGKHVGSLR